MDDSPERLEPVDIAVHVDQRLMRVIWSDGHEAVYDFEYLRWQCPCATCRGEGGPGMLDTVRELSRQQTELTDLHTVGRYGLTPTWGDGHATGIYTYTNLRALCQCPVCVREQPAAGAR